MHGASGREGVRQRSTQLHRIRPLFPMPRLTPKRGVRHERRDLAPHVARFLLLRGFEGAIFRVAFPTQRRHLVGTLGAGHVLRDESREALLFRGVLRRIGPLPSVDPLREVEPAPRENPRHHLLVSCVAIGGRGHESLLMLERDFRCVQEIPVVRLGDHDREQIQSLENGAQGASRLTSGPGGMSTSGPFAGLANERRVA